MFQSSSKKIKRENHNSAGSMKNRRTGSKPSFDLPDDVLDHIFSLVPVKQAVRIGIISRRFRNSWRFSRKLHFDRGFTRHRTNMDDILKINEVFSVHAGPIIQSLKLYVDPTNVEHMVKSWIDISISKGVEEVDLNFISARFMPYKLSPDFFDVKSIRILKLTFCNIEIRPNHRGIHFMNTLILKKVDISEEMVETVIRNCTLLETLEISRCNRIAQVRFHTYNLKRFRVLKLGDCTDLSAVEIGAPTLRSFYYSGAVPHLVIEDVPQLTDVVLNFTPPKAFMRHSSVRNILDCLAHIKALTVNSTFLEGVSPNFRDRKLGIYLQFSYWNLKELQLILEGAIYCNTYDIANFLINCPFVEKVFIDLNDCSFEGSIYWELHQKQELQYFRLLVYLKFVKLKGFRFQEHELELVKFFLQKAVNLETLVLINPKNRLYSRHFPANIEKHQQLFRWRASPKARVVVCEDINDETAQPLHEKVWH